MTINLINYALAKKDWEKAYEDLKVLEIGGRNLLLNSRINYLFGSGSYTIHELYEDPNEGIVLKSDRQYLYDNNLIVNPFIEEGTTLTFSFRIKGEQKGSVSFQLYDGVTLIRTQTIQVSDTWETISLTTTLIKNLNVPARIYVYPQGFPIYLKSIKIEKGNKATDWTPAPEDINAHPFVAELAETVFRSKQNEERIRNLENALTALGGGA